MAKAQRAFSLLYGLWILSLFAVGYSLYAEFIDHLPVCTLCWYQRVAIYSLTIVLTTGLLSEDLRCAHYALPLSWLVIMVSIAHLVTQWMPDWLPISLCTAHGPSCESIHLKLWGWVTFPALALVYGLLATSALHWVHKKTG